MVLLMEYWTGRLEKHSKVSHKDYLYLGLDTSAYTTSLAVVNQQEHLLVDRRIPLTVQKGNLGLRQSEAVFLHLKNLTVLWEDPYSLGKHGELVAIAASNQPRPVQGSYMPVFKVSEACGSFLAQTMGLNFLASSHQEGHIMAGLWSAGLAKGYYLIVQLSGGTTELVESEEISPGLLETRLVGQGSDLNAGQFIDRLGSLMGISFPAGPKLENLAKGGRDNVIKLPVAVKNSTISFSGPASSAERALQKGFRKEDLARAIEVCIADSLLRAIYNLDDSLKDYDGILFVGGVAANQYIRERLGKKIGPAKVYFPRSHFASDNAVGLAVQAARRFRV